MSTSKSQKVGVIYALVEKDSNCIRYVGQTGQPLNKRFNSHLNRSRKFKTPLGIWLSNNLDNVKPEVLEYCLLEDLNKKEIEWINKFTGLVNSMRGKGGNNYTHSEETRKLISKSSSGRHKGRTKSKEHKKKISETLKKRFINKANHPFYGKHLAEKHIQKIIKKNSKCVIQFSLDEKFIKKYDSVTKAALEMGTSITNISRCCRKQVRTSCGFIWKFEQTILYN